MQHGIGVGVVLRLPAVFRLPVVLLFAFLLLGGVAIAAPEDGRYSPDDGLVDEAPSAPVMVDGRVLFKVRGFSARPAEHRAGVIGDRIEALASDPGFTTDALRVDVRQDVHLLMAGAKPVMAITDGDARLEGVDRTTLAEAVRIRVGEAVDDWRRARSPEVLKRHALIAVGEMLALFLGLWLGARFFRRLRSFLDERLQKKIQDVQFKEFRIVRAQQIWRLLTHGLAFLWATIVLLSVVLFLASVLSLFPWTRWIAVDLLGLVLQPLRVLGTDLLRALPNLIFLVILFYLTRYLLKLVKLYFGNIAEGNVVLPEFEADWAWPTYRLVRLLLVAFAVIVAYPYIPGSGSAAFKGVSLFIGVIFSLGSSSLIGNVIAGYTMAYRRVFKVGDRVMIGSHKGRVEQVRMLVTYLCTEKNELVAVPNSVILNCEVVNFSTLAKEHGLIVHTTVGIGYETPWRQVEAMLLEAAARTEGLLKAPAPFVRHDALGDFCVTYEINAYCDDPHAMVRLRTELHRNILDLFNEYGVQIMTPAYEGDPREPKVVPRDQWYAPPARLPRSG